MAFPCWRVLGASLQRRVHPLSHAWFLFLDGRTGLWLPLSSEVSRSSVTLHLPTFFAVVPKEAPTLEEWLEAESAEAVDDIIKSPPPKMHQEILQVTLEDRAGSHTTSLGVARATA